MLYSILQGTFVGVSIALPFGPVSLLCVNRGLMGRASLGFVGGLGAATAHGAFASLAMAGAGVVASALLEWRTAVHLMSAAILIALGVRTLRKGPANQAAAPTESHQRVYLSGLMLALSNPMTILPYFAIASSSALGAIGSGRSHLLIVPGAMLGAACWYAMLSGLAAALRHRLARSLVRHLNVAAGAAFMGFGVVVGLS